MSGGRAGAVAGTRSRRRLRTECSGSAARHCSAEPHSPAIAAAPLPAPRVTPLPAPHITPLPAPRVTSLPAPRARLPQRCGHGGAAAAAPRSVQGPGRAALEGDLPPSECSCAGRAWPLLRTSPARPGSVAAGQAGPGRSRARSEGRGRGGSVRSAPGGPSGAPSSP